MIFCHLINMCTWNPHVLHQNLGGKNGCFPVQREPRWKDHWHNPALSCQPFTSWWPTFSTRLIHMGFVVEKGMGFSPRTSVFPCQLSLHRCYILSHSPTTNAIASLQLRALLNTFKKINHDWHVNSDAWQEDERHTERKTNHYCWHRDFPAYVPATWIKHNVTRRCAVCTTKDTRRESRAMSVWGVHLWAAPCFCIYHLSHTQACVRAHTPTQSRM
jgi:hypothetical protein